MSEAEESEEAPAEESEEEGLGEGSFPIETAITVSKEGKGALNIDAVAQGMLTLTFSQATGVSNRRNPAEPGFSL